MNELVQSRSFGSNAVTPPPEHSASFKSNAGHRRSICDSKAALAQFELLPDSAFVRLPVVISLLSCSKSTLWRLVKQSTLPPPTKYGKRISAWRVGDLRQALKNFKNSSDN